MKAYVYIKMAISLYYGLIYSVIEQSKSVYKSTHCLQKDTTIHLYSGVYYLARTLMFYDTRDNVSVTSVLLIGTTERINKYNFYIYAHIGTTNTTFGTILKQIQLIYYKFTQKI